MNWPSCIPARLVYVSRRKLHGPGRHAGVLVEWMGAPFVVERNIERGLEVLSVREFAQGREVRREAVVEDPTAVAGVFARIRECFKHAPGYDLFTRNCEHFARKALFNDDRSPQIQAMLVLGGLLICCIGLAER